MAKPPSDYDQDILDIIPERFEIDDEIIEEDEPPFWRRHLPLALGVLVVGGLVVAVLSFSDPPSPVNGNVPTITADTTAPRIRPENPGGLEVPDQDKLVYGGSDGSVPSSERLLPPPEAPKPLPPAPPQVAGPNEPPLPQAVPTTSVERLGGTGALPMKPPQTAAVVPPLPAPPVVAPLPPAPAVVPPAPAPAAKTLVEKPAAVIVNGGNYLIQLGALRSQADADKEWKRIQKANNDLLNGLNSDVVKADLPNGTFWRLRAGPVSEDSAKKLCTELKKRNQGCIVAKK